MSIRLLNSITENELRYIETHDSYVVEKLDMVFMKVSVGPDGAVLLCPPYFRSVDDTDRTINVMYSEIERTLCRDIDIHADEIISKYGACVIGFFYLPVSQTKHIDYRDASRPFFVSDIFFDDAKVGRAFPDKADVIADISGMLGVRSAVICKVGNGKELAAYARRYAAGEIDAVEFARLASAGNAMPSGLPIECVEGMIIKTARKRFQVVLNDTSSDIDRTVKKPYRDIVLRDFIKTMLDGEDLFWGVKPDSYIDAVSDIFMKYMNRTDVFKKYAFDPEDLEPPHEGYMADMDLSYIHTDAVRIICRYNPVAKCVLRMFLHMFREPFTVFRMDGASEEDIDKMRRLINEIFLLFVKKD